MLLGAKVDPWKMWGLGAPTPSTAENPHLTCDSPKTSANSLCWPEALPVININSQLTQILYVLHTILCIIYRYYILYSYNKG